MAVLYEGPDAIRPWYGAWEFDVLRMVGGIPGVYVKRVGGRNGAGIGYLRTEAANMLSWKAPGSGMFGAAVLCGSNGSYLLQDGDNPDKWVQVMVYTAHLEANQQASVWLNDIYENRVVLDDVTAAEASAGDVTTWTWEFKNKSSSFVLNVRVWLDADVSNIEISNDGVAWVSPTTEAGALALGNILSGNTVTLHMRRTIAASSSSDPSVLNLLRAAFWVGGVHYYTDFRGLYRVWNAAVYRFYRSSVAPPEEGDTPFATNVSLPHTPVDAFGNGTWWISLSYFNGVLDSGFYPVGPNGETCLRLDIAGGVEQPLPPNAPNDWQLQIMAGGIVRITAYYYQEGDERAEEWAIAYTTNGSTPPTDTPDETVAMPEHSLAVLNFDLPAQGHGTTVKVRLQTRRDDGGWVYSENSTVITVTADATGPGAPLEAERYPGVLLEGA